MLTRILPVLLCAALLGCPQAEPEPGCADDGCAADAYCDAATKQCRTDIVFADSNLERCVLDETGYASGPVYFTDVTGLTALECPDRKIASLEGLQHFPALQSLALWENEIDNLAPLAGLTTLSELQLGYNYIADLGPLAGLTGLRRLGLEINNLEDIAPLGNLWDLEWLNLDGNGIVDVSALWDLDRLSWVTAERNPIADTGPIDDLRAGGCEVYKRGDDGSGGAVGGAGGSPAVPLARERYHRSRLSYALAGDGELLLQYRGQQRAQQVVKEYAGTLRLRGRAIVYQLAGHELAVGSVGGGGFELCSGGFASACQLAIGVKWPEPGPGGARAATSGAPIYSANLVLRDADGRLGGPWRTKGNPSASLALEPFVLASPNQADAGSCIFMACTGAMEILMNQRVAPEAMTYKGDTDLSERYLMNAIDHVSSSAVPYTISDLIYTYAAAGGSLLDRDYGFIYAVDGQYLSAQVNWTDALPGNWQDLLVPTPPAERTIIFLDPRLNEQSIWNVGLMNDDVIQRIKYEIRTKHAPVIAVYNHYNYWHAVIIIGYDDSLEVGDCPFVRSTLSYFRGEGDAAAAANKIQQQMDAQGGCRSNGGFYVRDSIYDGGADEPNYDYGGHPDNYSKRVIIHEYDWVKYLANHAYTIHRS